MNTIKELVKSGKFEAVSFREKSIPGLGSPSISIEDVNTDIQVKIVKTINHMTGDITIVTKDNGYVKFWLKRDKEYYAKNYGKSYAH
jgi:hypothetical protein